MSDYVPIDPPSGARGAQGLRTGVFLAIIALAFVAGAVLTGYLMRHVPWLGGTTSAQKATPEPVNYNPALPLNANGERTNPQLDPNALASREATLAGQLSALETRTAAVTTDANAAAAQAGRGGAADRRRRAPCARSRCRPRLSRGAVAQPLRHRAAQGGRRGHRRRAPAGDAGGSAPGAGGDRARHRLGQHRRLARQPAPRSRRPRRAAPGRHPLAPPRRPARPRAPPARRRPGGGRPCRGRAPARRRAGRQLDAGRRPLYRGAPRARSHRKRRADGQAVARPIPPTTVQAQTPADTTPATDPDTNTQETTSVGM